jgi:hypothetical protein
MRWIAEIARRLAAIPFRNREEDLSRSSQLQA